MISIDGIFAPEVTIQISVNIILSTIYHYVEKRKQSTHTSF